jgi:2-polyprenyl-6-methoxyphenol hydroxylase-like FAD-dependent oxidoreductase
MDIVIAGAGIGGLTTALSLHDGGMDRVVVLESAPRLMPVGAGINLLPNAVRELAALGLYHEVADHAAHLHEVWYCNQHGDLILREPRGRSADCDWPQLSLRRGDLQLALADAVRVRLGEQKLRSGTRVTGMRNGTHRLVVRTTAGDVEASVLVGADGIHSTVRRALFGEEPAPVWNGTVVWRGLAWSRPPSPAGRMVIAGDGTRKVVAYAVTPPREDGRVLLNWAASRRFGEHRAVDRTDWNTGVPAAKFAPGFAGWRVAGVDLVELFESTESCFEFPMLDRDPLPAWTSGRATLLGDAAHAMAPMGSAAATQAVVDARAVAYFLGVAPDVETALAQYERHRRPATTRIQLANRDLGPEAVIDVVARRAPGGFSTVEDVCCPADLRAICDDYAALAAFDRHGVNIRSPYDIRRARLVGDKEPALLTV